MKITQELFHATSLSVVVPLFPEYGRDGSDLFDGVGGGIHPSHRAVDWLLAAGALCARPVPSR